jgi:hypothetical protein
MDHTKHMSARVAETGSPAIMRTRACKGRQNADRFQRFLHDFEMRRIQSQQRGVGGRQPPAFAVRFHPALILMEHFSSEQGFF